MALGRGSILVLVALIWSVPLHVAAAPAPLQTTLEYSVKANYLVRFAAFVEWPAQAFADSRSPVVICVVGRDPFSGALDRAARGQTAHGRPLTVRRPGTVEAAAGCHVLYVGRGGAELIPAGQRAILVVTDTAVSSDRGMIHFAIDDDRVRFHIDLQAASRSRLSISSRLLNLALSVRGG
ncbi:YfiR family protein [Roseibacterium beibuensis]|uniref:YfiR family protein n=1 Tax=[Roseibacterium] beibuensis TaxID=1193142 RepID=UPI00217E2D6D|nr:YfiR family protein [Roseibacterium beibuensis]MCS6626935.1 YfiR family protein [Roseibacterium beibuensis]